MTSKDRLMAISMGIFLPAVCIFGLADLADWHIDYCMGTSIVGLLAIGLTAAILGGDTKS